MPYLSVVLPCKNEESSLEDSILKIKQIFKSNHIRGEIIVSDSSLDNSPKIARRNGVTLVKHNKRGYGRACREGILKSSGKYIFMADPDSSYDFGEIPHFLKYLEKDKDFVIGNRLIGELKKGAMPWSHRYIGNPLLNHLLKILFRIKIGDANCGMRAVRKKAYDKLPLKTNGWEFSHEMVIQARIHNLSFLELPITYFPRKGKSKLHTLPGGIRQFFFILKFAYINKIKFNL